MYYNIILHRYVYICRYIYVGIYIYVYYNHIGLKDAMLGLNVNPLKMKKNMGLMLLIGLCVNQQIIWKPHGLYINPQAMWKPHGLYINLQAMWNPHGLYVNQ